MTSDIPNAFAQPDMPCKKDEERAMMKFRGVLAGMLCKIAYEVHGNFAIYENNEKVLCE